MSSGGKFSAPTVNVYAMCRKSPSLKGTMQKYPIKQSLRMRNSKKVVEVAVIRTIIN